MREYHGYLPWYLGGDPYFTYNEIKAILDDLEKRAEEAKKEEREARRRKAGGQSRSR